VKRDDSRPATGDRVREADSSLDGGQVNPFTAKQGQYLAFIHYYTRVNGVAPAEADFQRYFRVSAPSVHAMILKLEAGRWINRVPGAGRSIRLLVAREALPDLD
jgi:DNA-binding MarR family transcriptional regulator